MIASKISVVLLGIFSLLSANGQMKNWDQLQINIPDGWSSAQKKGSIQYSNYNIKGSEPLSITLFANQPYQGTPDTLFSMAWKKLVGVPVESEEIPRWRRFYTEDGELIQQGYLDNKSGTKDAGYKQLNVFVLEGSYQACLIEAISLKNFRPVQGDWQERMAGVKIISKKK